MSLNRISLILIVLLFFPVFIYHTYSQTEFEPFWGINNCPKNNDVRVLSVDSDDVLYAGVWGDGIYKSTDDGISWQRASSGLFNTFVTCIEIDTAGTVYAGTFGSGIFKSTNQGSVWTQISTEFLNELNIKAIAIYPNGNILAGTYGGGISRLDSSNKWRTLNNRINFMDVNCIVIPDDSVIVAGTNGGGIFRSTDDGANWFPVNSGLRSYTITDLCIGENGIMYAATLGGGVHISYQGGTGWSVYYDKSSHPINATCLVEYDDEEPLVGTNDVGLIKFDLDVLDLPPANNPWAFTDLDKYGVNDLVVNSRGYVFTAQPYNGILRSTDGGYTFDKETVQHFSLSGEDDEVGLTPLYAGENGLMLCSNIEGGIYRSEDKGHTWDRVALEGVQVHNYFEASNGNFYAATASGAYKSTDNGESWANTGWTNEIYAIAVNDDDLIFITDTVFRRSTDGGNTWETSGYVGAFKYRYLGLAPNGDLYCQQYREEERDLGLAKSTDDGVTWSISLNHDDGMAECIAFKGNTVLVGAQGGLYISNNFGSSWNLNKFGFDFYSWVRNVVVSDDGNILVYNHSLKLVLKSIDDGATWDTLWGGMIKGQIESLDINNEGDMFLSTTVLYRSIANDDLIVPDIVYPINDIDGQPQHPVFDWKAVHNADLYEVQIAMDKEFSEAEIVEYSILSATDWTPVYPLEYNSKYFWRVRSKRNKSVSAWSETGSFFTETAPPELIYPEVNAFGLDTVFTHYWNKVEEAYGYHIQIATDEYFNDILEEKENINDSVYDIKGLVLDKNYYWRVRSLSGKGTSSWSEVRKFTTKLPAPELIKPLHEEFVPYNIVNFAWLPLDKADIYSIQVSRDSLFDDIAYEGPTDNDSTHQLLTLTYGISYYWRIKGESDTNYSYWSETRKFTTDLEAAILVSPDNFAANLELPIEFIWDATKDATSYHFQLANDADFNDIIYEAENLEDKSLIYEENLEFGTYYWRVRIFADELPGLWADPWSFSINPGYVELLSPENNANNVAEDDRFEWDAPELAEQFHIQVATDEEFSNIVFEKKELTAKAISVSQAGLDVAAKYYWRVRLIADGIAGLWSEVYNFKTGLRSPTLIYPVNEATKIDINCEFAWQSVSQAELYNLQIAKDKNFSDIVHDIDDISETKQKVTLDSGTNYYWHVKAKYSGGEGSWSYTRSLQTAGHPSGVDNPDGPLEYLSVIPNPVNDRTEIKLILNSYGKVRIDIIDSYGRTVKGLLYSYQPAGELVVSWRPDNISEGVYYVRINAAGRNYLKQIVFVK